jgi:hypothetical protein
MAAWQQQRNIDGPSPRTRCGIAEGVPLRVWCECGRSAVIPIADLLRRGVPPDTRLYEVIDRLRCLGCGGRPSTEVPH